MLKTYRWSGFNKDLKLKGISSIGGATVLHTEG